VSVSVMWVCSLHVYVYAAGRHLFCTHMVFTHVLRTHVLITQQHSPSLGTCYHFTYKLVCHDHSILIAAFACYVNLISTDSMFSSCLLPATFVIVLRSIAVCCYPVCHVVFHCTHHVLCVCCTRSWERQSLSRQKKYMNTSMCGHAC